MYHRHLCNSPKNIIIVLVLLVKFFSKLFLKNVFIDSRMSCNIFWLQTDPLLTVPNFLSSRICFLWSLKSSLFLLNAVGCESIPWSGQPTSHRTSRENWLFLSQQLPIDPQLGLGVPAQIIIFKSCEYPFVEFDYVVINSPAHDLYKQCYNKKICICLCTWRVLDEIIKVQLVDQ